MTLHEAIEKLLKQSGRPMTTQEIANELNENGWYQKKDSSPIQAFQIHGRTRNYANIFNRIGSTVSLIEPTAIKSTVRIVEQKSMVSIAARANFKDIKTSFEPISNPDTAILILGTMPGDKSIASREYYGHSRNNFWKIIAAITDSKLPQDYNEKKALLLKKRIGVWDVVHRAVRKGSLDTEIVNEEPNDLNSFIAIQEFKSDRFQRF